MLIATSSLISNKVTCSLFRLLVWPGYYRRRNLFQSRIVASMPRKSVDGLQSAIDDIKWHQVAEPRRKASVIAMPGREQRMSLPCPAIRHRHKRLSKKSTDAIKDACLIRHRRPKKPQERYCRFDYIGALHTPTDWRAPTGTI